MRTTPKLLADKKQPVDVDKGWEKLRAYDERAFELSLELGVIMDMPCTLIYADGEPISLYVERYKRWREHDEIRDKATVILIGFKPEQEVQFIAQACHKRNVKCTERRLDTRRLHLKFQPVLVRRAL